MPRFVIINAENIEKEKLGVPIKTPFTKEEVQQLAIAFVDRNDFVTDGERVVEKITAILNHYTRLYETTS